MQLKHHKKTGDIAVQTRGNISDAEVFKIIQELLKKNPDIQYAAPIDSIEGMFSSCALTRVTATPNVEYKYFWRTYSGVLRVMNFLDEDFFRIVTLRSPRVTPDTVMANYNGAIVIPGLFDPQRTQHVYCDGTYNEIEKAKTREIEPRFDTCERAVAIDSGAINNITSLSRYSEKVSAPVPISPFALSSLTATLILYYLLIIRIVFRYVGVGIIRFAKNGEALMKQRLFTMSSILFMIFVFPIIYLLNLL